MLSWYVGRSARHVDSLNMLQLPADYSVQYRLIIIYFITKTQSSNYFSSHHAHHHPTLCSPVILRFNNENHAASHPRPLQYNIFWLFFWECSELCFSILTVIFQYAGCLKYGREKLVQSNPDYHLEKWKSSRKEMIVFLVKIFCFLENRYYFFFLTHITSETEVVIVLNESFCLWQL